MNFNLSIFNPAELNVPMKIVCPLIWCLAPLIAQGGPAPLSTPATNYQQATTNAHFKQTAPGIYQLGLVTLNRKLNEVTFPASVNQTQGPVEYVLVSTQGKLHESVLKTEAEPYHIHLGMLLLDAKGAPKNSMSQLNTDAIPGDAIEVWVNVKPPGQEKKLRAESLVWNTSTSNALAIGDWTYSGSRVIDGTFLAQRDRSLIAIIKDIDALINHPGTTAQKDENWQVNTRLCPPLDTPVEVVLKLKPAKR